LWLGHIPCNQTPKNIHQAKTMIVIGSCNEKDYYNKQQIPRKAKKRKLQDFR